MRLAPILTLLTPLVIAAPASEQRRDLIDEFTHLLEFIDVFITTQTLIDNTVSIDFQVQNPTIIDLRVLSIDTTSSVNGTQLVKFKHNFSNFVVPALGSANSGNIPNITLTQGAVNSLPFITAGVLDTQSVLNVVAGIIPIPFFPYNQDAVPANFSISD